MGLVDHQGRPLRKQRGQGLHVVQRARAEDHEELRTRTRTGGAPAFRLARSLARRIAAAMERHAGRSGRGAFEEPAAVGVDLEPRSRGVEGGAQGRGGRGGYGSAVFEKTQISLKKFVLWHRPWSAQWESRAGFFEFLKSSTSDGRRTPYSERRSEKSKRRMSPDSVKFLASVLGEELLHSASERTKSSPSLTPLATVIVLW
jgi:hypothetical protein